MEASQLRKDARAALAGHWPAAVLSGLAAACMGGNAGVLAVLLSLEGFLDRLAVTAPKLMVWLGVFGALGFAWCFGCATLGSVVRLGWKRYCLALADGGAPRCHELLSGFGRIGQALWLDVLRLLAVAAGTAALVVPGVVLYLRYAMAPYILAEDPGCTAREAMERSAAMMKGRKWDLFYMELSFLGWVLASLVTCWAGNLLLTPYMATARAVFYRRVSAGRE